MEAKQDYEAFYDQEIAYRRELNEPPFSQLIRLTYVHPSEAAGKAEAERVKRQFEAEIARRGIVDVRIIGPAPAFVAKLRGRYRWQITLRGNNPAKLLSDAYVLSDSTIQRKREMSNWAFDVDPVGLD